MVKKGSAKRVSKTLGELVSLSIIDLPIIIEDLCYRLWETKMDENTAALYIRIILVRNMDVNSLIGSALRLEVDVAYKIGRSIAVLHDGIVMNRWKIRCPSYADLKIKVVLDSHHFKTVSHEEETSRWVIIYINAKKSEKNFSPFFGPWGRPWWVP